MDSQKFCLKWNNYHQSVSSVFDNLRQDEELVDITLCCEGLKIKAHRMMLSACSPYFRDLLKENPCQHPVFFLKDTSYSDIAAVVEFVYKGEVNVAQNQLASFLKTAEMLQVRGLTGDEDEEGSSSATPASTSKTKQQEQQQHTPLSSRGKSRRSLSPPAHSSSSSSSTCWPHAANTPANSSSAVVVGTSSSSTFDYPAAASPVVVIHSPPSTPLSQQPPPAKRVRVSDIEPVDISTGDCTAAAAADGRLSPAGVVVVVSGDDVATSQSQCHNAAPSAAAAVESRHHNYPLCLPPSMTDAAAMSAAASSCSMEPDGGGGGVRRGAGASIKVEKLDLTDSDDGSSLDATFSAGAAAAAGVSLFESSQLDGSGTAAAVMGGGGGAAAGVLDAMSVGVDQQLSGLLRATSAQGTALGDLSMRLAAASGDDGSQGTTSIGGGSGGYVRICELCNRPLFSMSSYTCHMSMHRGRTCCPVCGRVLSSRQRLSNHMRTQHGSESLPLTAAASSSASSVAAAAASSLQHREQFDSSLLAELPIKLHPAFHQRPTAAEAESVQPHDQK